MKLIYYFIMLQVASNTIQAQNKTVPLTKTIISGHFTDERNNDTVSIEFYEQRLGSTSAGVQNISGATVHGDFHFEIPIVDNLSYVKVVSVKKPYLLLFDYLIKKGDSVFVNINTDIFTKNGRYDYKGLRFTGINSHAFMARYLTDSIFIDRLNESPTQVISMDSIKKNISYLWDGLFNAMEKTQINKLKYLEKEKSILDNEVYDILKTDCYFDILKSELNQFINQWNKIRFREDSTTRRKKMMDYYTAHFQNSETGFTISLNAKKVSKSYIDFLCEKVIFEDLLKKKDQTDNDCISLIPFIEGSDKAIQQKLAASLIAIIGSSSEKKEFDSLVRYGLTKVYDPFLRSVVDNYFATAIKGSAGYPFILADYHGEKVSFSSLKGKTVLVDFWFTGCTGCVQVANGLKKVKEHFRNDTTIAFVSISTDKDLDTWGEGLKSGLYTDKESINLYTMGEGQHHALINYYHINGYPKLILFDSGGKMFSFNAPRPDVFNGFTNLVNTIEEAKHQ